MQESPVESSLVLSIIALQNKVSSTSVDFLSLSLLRWLYRYSYLINSSASFIFAKFCFESHWIYCEVISLLL